MSLIKSKTQQTQTVGGTYGARREISKTLPTTTQPAKAAQHQPLDKFMSTGKRPANLGDFASNATFKTARAKFSEGAPYKRALHDRIENGTVPLKAIAQPISDDKLLSYLERVIATQPENGVRTARPVGKPAIPAKPVQAQRPQQAPASAKPTVSPAAQVRVRPSLTPARK